MATRTGKRPETKRPPSRAARARDQLRKMGRTQFKCNCGCNGNWKDYRLWNAHMLKNYGGYWGGKAGKAMGRKIGKETDKIRRMGRAGLEAFGHADHKGQRTDRWRSRPETKDGRVHLTRRALKARQDHSDDHARADKLERQAKEARAKRDEYAAGKREAKARELRDRHPVRPAPVRPARTPAPARSPNGQLPGRTARQQPAKTGRTGR